MATNKFILVYRMAYYKDYFYKPEFILCAMSKSGSYVSMAIKDTFDDMFLFIRKYKITISEFRISNN